MLLSSVPSSADITEVLLRLSWCTYLSVVSFSVILHLGYQLAAQVVAAGDHFGGQVLLVVQVDIENGLAALGLEGAVAVAVVYEGGKSAMTNSHLFTF